MLDAARLLWILLAPWCLGALALRALGLSPAGDRMRHAARAYAIGCLLLALSLWGALVAGLPSWLWPFLPLAIAPPLALCNGRAAALVAPSSPAMHWSLRLVVGLGLALALLQIAASFSYPCVLGDEANWWALKAKSLFLDWPAGVFEASQRHSWHPDYPMLNPLLQTWVYAQFGEIAHFANRLPIQACGVAMFLLLAGALRRRTGDRLAALLLLPFLLEPEFADVCGTAHADGMVGFGLLLAFDAWLERAEGDAPRGAAAVAAAGATFALWSKNEAMLYCALFFGVWLVATAFGRLPRPSRLAAWTFAPIGVVVLQRVWNDVFSLRNDLLGGGENSVGALLARQWGERAWPVLQAFVDAVCVPTRLHAALLPLFVALLLKALLRGRAALPARLWAPALALTGAVMALHVIYIGSYLQLDFHLATSQRRVLFQLVPTSLLWIAAWRAAAAGR